MAQNEEQIYDEVAELNEDQSLFFDLRLVQNRINHDAVIGLFCRDFLDFFALKGIAKKLPQSEFILAPQIYDIKKRQNIFYYNTLIRSLNREALPWRIFIPRHYTLETFFAKKYKALVSRKFSPFFVSAELVPLKKIFLLDANLPQILAGSNCAYGADLVLLPGPESEYPHRHFGRTQNVGVSRFDMSKSSSDTRDDEPHVRGTPRILYIASTIKNAAGFAAGLLAIKNLYRQVEVYIPTLPHGNALEDIDDLWLYNRTVDQLENLGAAISHENTDIFQRIAESDIVILDDGYFLMDAIRGAIPVVVYEPDFWQTVFLPQSGVKPTNWRNFGKTDPQDFEIGVILQNMSNLPAALELIQKNKDKYARNLLELKTRLISLHGGNPTELTAQTILKESRGGRSQEHFLTRILHAELVRSQANGNKEDAAARLLTLIKSLWA